jgi:hypothetical protein
MTARVVALAVAAVGAMGLWAPHASGQQTQRYTGTTDQDQPITLKVGAGTVDFSFAFDAVCAGERMVIPIESTTSLTEAGSFLGEGTFAGGTATFRILGDRPTGRTRTGTVSLASPDCQPLEAAWTAERPAIVTGGQCDDPRPSRRLTLEKLTARRIACGPARRAAARWAARCYARQWARGADRCRFSSGGRRWTGRMKIVGPSGSGGHSRITIISGRARATFYASARPIG